MPLRLWRAGGAELETEHLASLVAGPAGATADVWPGRVTRGPSEAAEVAPAIESFRLGVRFLDLRVALAAGDRNAADRVLVRFDQTFGGMNFLGDIPDKYKALRKQVGDEQVAPRSLLAGAGALETKDFKDLVEPSYVDLGRWTEACRLSGQAGKSALFRERAGRRLLDQAVRPDAKEPSDLPQPAIAILNAMRAEVAADHPDVAALAQSCKQLLEQLDYD